MVRVRRGDRVVDGNGLENRRGATHREFESRPLRQENRSGFMSDLFSCSEVAILTCGRLAVVQLQFGAVNEAKKSTKVYPHP